MRKAAPGAARRAPAEEARGADVQETLRALQEEMLQAAEALEFERAAYLRDQIRTLKAAAAAKRAPKGAS